MNKMIVVANSAQINQNSSILSIGQIILVGRIDLPANLFDAVD